MPSTSSSGEQANRSRSSTQALASRYRHLFVLPSTGALLLLTGVSTAALTLLARGVGVSLLQLASVLVVTFLSISAVSSALHSLDKGTIATFRRTCATMFAGEVTWLLCGGFGSAFALMTGSARPLNDALTFGAFLCAGFEFLVIKGAFTGRTVLSFGLSAIHPLSTFLLLQLPGPIGPIDFLAIVLGAAAFATTVAFPLALQNWKTSRGYGAVTLFQAFMKSWTMREAGDLEKIISAHAEPAEATTKVLRFQQQTGDIFVILPGVHPGPFFPVGSYNLPGVIGREFGKIGHVITLHRPGGHERNLATREETLRYASEVSRFAGTVALAPEPATMRGPVFGRVGNANVSSLQFAGDLLLTISFAPLGSDDMETRTENELAELGASAGLDVSVVDAHNSIDQALESPDTKDLGWARFLQEAVGTKPERIRVGYAHSSEVNFQGAEDITENGIGLMLFEASQEKSALILADANNAVPSLHSETAKALEAAGYRLVEFCTSDSHDLAARGLTVTRGYRALGESTPVGVIARTAVDLGRLAETRLSSCTYGSGLLKTTVNVFGARALDEFASITQASSRFAKTYSRIAIPAITLLFLASLIF